MADGLVAEPNTEDAENAGTEAGDAGKSGAKDDSSGANDAPGGENVAADGGDDGEGGAENGSEGDGKPSGSLIDKAKAAAGMDFTPDPVPEDNLDDLIPEGVEIEDKDALKSYIDLVNGAKSRAEIVKGTLELLSEYNAKSTEAIVEQWNRTTARWQEEVKSDPEIGGENLDRTLAKAYQVIQTYSPDPKGFEEVMTLTGAGNSIHVIRLLAAIADAVPGEAAPVKGQNTQQPASQVERFARMLNEQGT